MWQEEQETLFAVGDEVRFKWPPFLAGKTGVVTRIPKYPGLLVSVRIDISNRAFKVHAEDCTRLSPLELLARCAD